MINNRELYHYGVKGMRWGIIRWKDKLGYGRLSKKVSKYDKKIAKLDSKGKNRNKKYTKYVKKRNAIQSVMSRKYSSLSDDEKKSGRKAYQRLITGAKIAGVAIGGLAIKNLIDNLKSNAKTIVANNKSDTRTWTSSLYKDDRLKSVDYQLTGEIRDKVELEVRDAIQIGKYTIVSPWTRMAQGTATPQYNEWGGPTYTYTDFVENGRGK